MSRASQAICSLKLRHVSALKGPLSMSHNIHKEECTYVYYNYARTMQNYMAL
jgi:hypothetical protein